MAPPKGMAKKNGAASESRNATFWRVGLWLLSGLCVIIIGTIWYSGKGETQDALISGRRLIIHLDTGAIEGKQVASETLGSPAQAKPGPQPESAPESKPETKPESKAESKAESKPESAESPVANSSPESATESAAESETESESQPAPHESGEAAQPPASPTLADTMSIKPAAVPLAAINPSLQEQTSVGTLPRTGPKGLKPWRYYAKPYSHKGHLPTIAVLITGLGQNKSVSEGAIRLPENFSLSFSPYARELSSWTNAARIAGHEILLDLPLEPSNFPASDPGPYGLLIGKGDQENANRMQWLMSRIEGYTGFVTPQNEAFSANSAAFKALLDLLSSRGLMIVMEHEPAKNETKKILDASTTPYTIADIRIDEELSESAIKARLEALEKLASKRGYAVGIAQSYPLTIQQLQAWSDELEKNGYTLVPITFITGLKFQS